MFSQQIKHVLKAYLVTIDIVKAFDSLIHFFLVAVIGKFGFGASFLGWIEAV